jgi:hypothetical protein
LHRHTTTGRGLLKTSVAKPEQWRSDQRKPVSAELVDLPEVAL